MKLLILSAPGGSGHIQAAKALAATTAEDPRNISVAHINIADFFSPQSLALAFFQSYEYSVQHTPTLWGVSYYITNNHVAHTLVRRVFVPLLQTLYRKELNRLNQQIAQFAPDAIVCTHPAARFTIIKPLCPISIIITDYGFHSLWAYDKDDTYFIPSVPVQQGLVRYGVSPNNCIMSGIPIAPIFFEEKNIETLRHKYTIDPYKKTILILTGGKGLFDPTPILAALNQSKEALSIIVVAGKNPSLEQRLSHLHVSDQHTYQVIGWTDTIDEYMHIADYIITKPGGLTTSECLALQKPMILVSPIPGQERANCTLLCQMGAAIYAKNPGNILEHLNKRVLSQKKSPNASRVILDTIVQKSN
jgi:processive 1,2-diacylglycerol beta-glucosyltransferase